MHYCLVVVLPGGNCWPPGTISCIIPRCATRKRGYLRLGSTNGQGRIQPLGLGVQTATGGSRLFPWGHLFVAKRYLIFYPWIWAGHLILALEINKLTFWKTKFSKKKHFVGFFSIKKKHFRGQKSLKIHQNAIFRSIYTHK